MKESYWYARARAKEMKDGDNRKASQRKRRNIIMGLDGKGDVWPDDRGMLESIVADYFGNLFYIRWSI